MEELLSAHEHLDKYWRSAVDLLCSNKINTNIHIILSNKESIDRFFNILGEYKDRINYFVLLPYIAMGRASERIIESEYLFNRLKSIGKEISKVSYGSNFYGELQKNKWVDVSIYSPEMFSKYLDMNNMKLYKSSFDLEEIH